MNSNSALTFIFGLIAVHVSLLRFISKEIEWASTIIIAYSTSAFFIVDVEKQLLQYNKKKLFLYHTNKLVACGFSIPNAPI